MAVFGAGSFRQNARVQEFSDGIQQVAAFYREALTSSYSVVNDSTLIGDTARGTYVEADMANSTLNEYVMAGDRVARGSGADQREAITDFGPSGRTLSLSNFGLDFPATGAVKHDILSQEDNSGTVVVSSNPKTVFFAPDGKILFLENGNVLSASSSDYTTRGSLKLFFCSTGTDLQGQVTINSSSGIIKTTIEQGLTTCS